MLNFILKNSKTKALQKKLYDQLAIKHRNFFSATYLTEIAL